MRDEIPEEQEFSYAERFEKGEKDFLNDDEKRLFQSYSELRGLLHTMPVPKAGEKNLMKNLRSELHSGSGKWFRWHGIHFRQDVFHPVVIRCFCLLLGIMIVSAGVLIMPDNPNLQSFRFYQSETNSNPLGLLSDWKMRHGFTVTAPGQVPLQITLKDRTRIVCQPGTKLAFIPEHTRSFHLYLGEIHVKAKSNVENPMMIITPHGNVKVVGTEFRVRIIDK